MKCIVFAVFSACVFLSSITAGASELLLLDVHDGASVSGVVSDEAAVADFGETRAAKALGPAIEGDGLPTVHESAETPAPSTEEGSFSIVLRAPDGELLRDEQSILGGSPLFRTFCGHKRPQVGWRHVPLRARTAAIVMTDLDGVPGRDAVHWLRYGIPLYRPQDAASEDEAWSGLGGPNDFRVRAYVGLCSPQDLTARHLRITVYAVDTPEGAIPDGLNAADLEAYFGTHILARASILITTRP